MPQFHGFVHLRVIAETKKRKNGNLLLERSSWQGLPVKVIASLCRQDFSLVLKMQIENTREAWSYEMTNLIRVRETEANWTWKLLH